MNDLYEDLRDGHNLISLLEVLSGDTLVSFELLDLFEKKYIIFFQNEHSVFEHRQFRLFVVFVYLSHVFLPERVLVPNRF